MRLKREWRLKKEMNWIDNLKKVKKSNKIFACVCIIITLVLSYLLYASEYHYADDEETLTTAVNEFLWPFNPDLKYQVLESKKVGRTMVASFKDLIDENKYGVAVFAKGLNNRYRIISAQRSNSDYSSVVEVYELKINKKSYYAVSGYNLSKEIEFYGLNYFDFYSTDNKTEAQKTKTLRFAVEKPQFLDIYRAEELDEEALDGIGEESWKYRIRSASFYDESGNDVTAKYEVADKINPWSSSSAKMELFLLNIYIGIIMVFGAVVTRYFLTK